MPKRERKKTRKWEIFPIFPLSTSPSLASSCVISILVFFLSCGGRRLTHTSWNCRRLAQRCALSLMCKSEKRKKRHVRRTRKKLRKQIRKNYLINLWYIINRGFFFLLFLRTFAVAAMRVVQRHTFVRQGHCAWRNFQFRDMINYLLFRFMKKKEEEKK